MVIRSKVPSWAIALCLTVSLMAPSGSHPVRADPLTDSFASGGKRPAHKPATKPAKKPGGGGSHGSRVKPAPHRSSPGNPKVRADDLARQGSSGTESGSPSPRREPPEAEERPRTRRAAEREEAAAPAAPSRRTNRDSDETHVDENDEPRPTKTAPRKTAVTKGVAGKKKPNAKRDDNGEEGSTEGNEAGAREAEGNGVDEQDDTDETAPFASLPSVVPRAFTLGLSAALMGRNFQFGAPAVLQHESSFPRLGFVVDLETFPLLLMSAGWWRQIGLGAFYASEPSGEASVTDPMSGVSANTPVKQAQWGVDLRMAIPIGERLVFTPRLGLQAYSFTLSTKMPIMASSCTSAMTTACLPDTSVKMLTIGGIARIGASPDLGFSVGVAYLFGLDVTNRPVNEIGYEIGTSVTGYALEGGASWRLTDWIAIRALVPVTRLGYVFHPSTSPPTPAGVTYRSATELLYGFSVGVAVFTK